MSHLPWKHLSAWTNKDPSLEVNSWWMCVMKFRQILVPLLLSTDLKAHWCSPPLTLSLPLPYFTLSLSLFLSLCLSPSLSLSTKPLSVLSSDSQTLVWKFDSLEGKKKKNLTQPLTITHCLYMYVHIQAYIFSSVHLSFLLLLSSLLFIIIYHLFIYIFILIISIITGA